MAAQRRLVAFVSQKSRSYVSRPSTGPPGPPAQNRDLTLDIKSLQGSTASLFPANGPADERVSRHASRKGRVPGRSPARLAARGRAR